jgi:hypothetical protein
MGDFPLVLVGWTIQPHTTALLGARRVGQAAVPSFHLVSGQLQVLAGITVDIM